MFSVLRHIKLDFMRLLLVDNVLQCNAQIESILRLHAVNNTFPRYQIYFFAPGWVIISCGSCCLHRQSQSQFPGCAEQWNPRSYSRLLLWSRIGDGILSLIRGKSRSYNFVVSSPTSNSFCFESPGFLKQLEIDSTFYSMQVSLSSLPHECFHSD